MQDSVFQFNAWFRGAARVCQPPQTHGEETADREEAEKLDELPNWPMFLRSFSRFACECFQHVIAFRFSPQQQSNNIHYSLIFYNLFSYPFGTLTLLQLPAELPCTSPEPVLALLRPRDAPTHIVERPQATSWTSVKLKWRENIWLVNQTVFWE